MDTITLDPRTATFSDGLHLLARVADALQPLVDEDRIGISPGYPGVLVFAHGDTPEDKKANGTAAGRIIRDITGLTVEKRYSDGDVRLRCDIVTHKLAISVVISGVCTRTVVGTETVDVEKVVSKVVETVTEERDIVEWDCGGGILLNGDEE